MKTHDENFILPIYKSQVRLHMGYCVQFWPPMYKKDMEVVQLVQRREPKVIHGMGGLQCPGKIPILELLCWNIMMWGDLITNYKYAVPELVVLVLCYSAMISIGRGTMLINISGKYKNVIRSILVQENIACKKSECALIVVLQELNK